MIVKEVQDLAPYRAAVVFVFSRRVTTGIGRPFVNGPIAFTRCCLSSHKREVMKTPLSTRILVVNGDTVELILKRLYKIR